MPSRPHSAPVKKSGNLVNLVNLSIGFGSNQPPPTTNPVLSNGIRPHGGIRGQRRHPPSPYSYNKSADYVHDVEHEAELYFEDNDDTRSNISDMPKLLDLNEGGQEKQQILPPNSQYRIPSRSKNRSNIKIVVQNLEVKFELEQKFNCSEYANLLASQLLKGTVPPYRPLRCHQYLTLTELKDASAKESNVKLGRPTRATLLRARQMSTVHKLVKEQRNDEKQARDLDVWAERRKLAVEQILDVSLPEGQTMHGFMVGARYNRAHYLDAKSVTEYGLYLPRHAPEMCFVTNNKKLLADEEETTQNDEESKKEPGTSDANFSAGHGSAEHEPLLSFQMKRGNNVFLGNRPTNLATIGRTGSARQAWAEQLADESPVHTKPSRAASLRVKGSALQQEPSMSSLPSAPIVRQRRAQSAHPAMSGSSRPPTVYIPVHVQGKALSSTVPQLPAAAGGVPISQRDDLQRHLSSGSSVAENGHDENDELVVAPASSPRGEQSTSARFISNLVAAAAADLQQNEVAENESIACTAGATPTADLDSAASDTEDDHPAIQVTVNSSSVESSTEIDSRNFSSNELLHINKQLVKPRVAKPAPRAVEKVDRSFNVPSLSGEESNMADVEEQQLLSDSQTDNFKSEATSDLTNETIAEKANVDQCDAETMAVEQQDMASRPTSALSKKSSSLHRVSSAKKVRFADESMPPGDEPSSPESAGPKVATGAAGSRRPGSAKTGIVRHNTWNGNSTAPVAEPPALTAHAISKPAAGGGGVHSRLYDNDNVNNESDNADSGLKWKDLRDMPSEKTLPATHLTDESSQ